MALKMKWQSGYDCGIEEIDVPMTEKGKVKFAEYILAAARHGWCMSIFVEHSDNEEEE